MADPATSASAVTPVRVPSLVERIAGIFNRATPRLGPQEDLKQTTETGFTSPSAAMSEMWSQYFQGDNARMAIYRDVDKMDRGSEEASRALNTIANNATSSEDGTQQSFAVSSENEKVQAIIDNLVARTRLHTKMKAFFRNTVKNGDLFWEIDVNSNLEVVAVKQRPPESMYRNEDAHGELKLGAPRYGPDGKCLNKPGECAFEQRTEDGKLLATFWPWQIIHVRHDHDDLQAYGKSLFLVSRSTWKKLKAMEEGLVIGRLTRDLMKLVFYVDTTGLSPAQKRVALADFKASINQRNKIDGKRESPFSVMTDFFFTRGYIEGRDGRKYAQQTSVEVIDPKNSGLHNIADIEFFQRKFLSTLVVPPSHMSFEKDSEAGVVSQQDVQYVRYLRGLQQDGSIALEQLFDFQLILEGVDPYDPANSYEVTWPSLKATNEAAAANTALAFAQRDQIHLQEGVISVEYIREHEYGMSDEESELVDEQIAVAEQKELDNLAAQTAIGAVVQNNVTGPGAQAGGTPPAGSQSKSAGIPSQVNVPSVHRDVDGKRKGDEGRTRDGQRIAPTRSKPKGTPPGSGKRKRAVAAENVHLLNYIASLSGSPRLRVVAEYEPEPEPEPTVRRDHLDLVADAFQRRADFLAGHLAAPAPLPPPIPPPTPSTHVEIHLAEGMVKAEETHHHQHTTKVELPEQKAPQVDIHNQVTVPEIRLPEVAPPVVQNHISVPAAEAPRVEVHAEVKVPEQKAPAPPAIHVHVPEQAAPKVEVHHHAPEQAAPKVEVHNHIEVSDADPLPLEVRRDDQGRVSEVRPKKR